MFTIKLLHTNGSRKGKRYLVSKSPFTVGRHESCDLAFDTRTISRKHCAIHFDDAKVILRDLDSRNGTAVDGVLIPAHEPCELSHHSILQIGKYTFRISIRDQNTNEPHRPLAADLSTLSGVRISGLDRGAEQLMSELDDLASQLERAPQKEPFESRPEKDRIGLAKNQSDQRQRSVEDSDDRISSEDEHESVAEPVADTEDEEATVMLSANSPPDCGDDQEADSVADTSKGPKKIPDHLRPKAPKDSQDAASEALKNLFIR